MQRVSYRRAVAADASAIAKIEAEIFTDAWGEASVLSYIDTAFVAELDGAVGAYLIASLIAPEGELYRIAVRDSFRRAGVGTGLFSYAIEELSRRGLTTLFLEVREKNLPARALYGSLGFRECGVRRGYYKNPDDNAILMVYGNENSCI